MLVECVISDWDGCYSDSWKGVIVDEAFAHPAKFAYGLVTRIVDHGLKQGYWQKGSIVGDPFGGVALGGVICGARGVNWLGVELEPKFVELGNQNLEKHGPLFLHSGATCVKLVQGDSRGFAGIVGEVTGVVCSPPFSGTEQPCASQTKELKDYHAFTRGDGTKRDKALTQGTPGQIGSLRTGSLEAVISSPPFAESIGSGEAARKILRDNYKTRDTQNTSQAAIDRLETRFANDYGSTPGNIGNLKAGDLDGIVTSPPFGDNQRGGTGVVTHPDDCSCNFCQKNKKNAGNSQGGKWTQTAEGNIGNLKAGELSGIVTSPPWQENCEGGVRRDKFKDPEAFAQGMEERSGQGSYHTASAAARKKQFERQNSQIYGDSDGQIGQEKSEDYWTAVKTVYEQCRIALKPNGIMAIVVKDFVKGGQIVPLCDQTCQLLESIGFTVFERTRCHLVKETRERSLFGEDIVTTKSRKSFFRRLAEKNGSPEINWEEIIWARAE